MNLDLKAEKELEYKGPFKQMKDPVQRLRDGYESEVLVTFEHGGHWIRMRWRRQAGLEEGKANEGFFFLANAGS